MRILSLTAGAASMICGSCLRDNTLAAELTRRGHDVTLLPIYTPTHTDEQNVSEKRVFFGGISVYLQQYVPLLRRTPAVLDRLWDSTPILKLASRRSIKTDGRMLGELTISMLRGEHGHQRKELDKLVTWLKTHTSGFDVVNLPFALLIGLARPIRAALGAPIVCTLQGEDLFLEDLQEAYRREAIDLIKAQVREVDAFISVSDYYAHFASQYLGIDRHDIVSVPLGINMSDLERARVRGPIDPDEISPQWPPPQRPFTIGYFARIAPEKGLDRLATAYRILRRERGLPPSRLEAAGWMGDAHREYLKTIERDLQQAGLGGEFAYHGELNRLDKFKFLGGLDVFSVPAPYREPKGLPVLEAMACGVPVVQPAHGAFPEMIHKTGGGLLVPPEDPESLADSIWQLWQDPKLRATLGHRGQQGVRAHYTAQKMAEGVEKVYGQVMRKRMSHPLPESATV
jgi:glycosyltransferase involved in cell wall biosynthesis